VTPPTIMTWTKPSVSSGKGQAEPHRGRRVALGGAGLAGERVEQREDELLRLEVERPALGPIAHDEGAHQPIARERARRMLGQEPEIVRPPTRGGHEAVEPFLDGGGGDVGGWHEVLAFWDSDEVG
jgi:hypothetical protein